MRKRSWTGGALLAALVIALAVGCGDDKSGGPTGPPITEVPESWRGVWELHMTAVLCGTPFEFVDTVLTQDICPGDSLELEFPFDLGDSLCTNRSFTATERFMQLWCSGPIQEGDCAGTLTASLRIDIDPAAGKMTGSGRVEVDFTTGEQCPIYCVEIAIEGSRIAGDPSCPLAKPAGSRPLFLEVLSRARRQ